MTARSVSSSPSPVVSVVIPTHNRSQLVVRAIQSVLDQTFEAFEVVVVDDASDDGTLERVRGLGDPRVGVLKHVRNQGGAAARNTGLRAGIGEYVAFLDSDDVWHPRRLAAAVEFHRAHRGPEPLVSYSMTRIVRETSIKTVPKHPIKPGQCVLEYILRDGFIQTSSLFGPLPFCRDVGFDERIRRLEDWNFLIEAQVEGAAFAMIPEVLVDHHAGAHLRVSHAPTIPSAREWLDERHGDVSLAAARSFRDSWIAYEDAVSGRPIRGSAAALRGFLLRRVRLRTAAGVTRAAAVHTWRDWRGPVTSRNRSA